jgi:site-specific recombinase XerD
VLKYHQLDILIKTANSQHSNSVLLSFVPSHFTAFPLTKTTIANCPQYLLLSVCPITPIITPSMFIRHYQFNTLIKSYNYTPSNIKYLSKEEIERLFSCIKNSRDKALFGLTYLYGLRVSEALSLKLSHIDLENKRILIHRMKGGIGGERPLFETAEKLIRKYLKKRIDTGDALFTGRQGNLSRQRVQQLFKAYAQKAGINPKYSVHSLRHSIATHLLENGVSVEQVRQFLGHSQIETTETYTHISQQQLNKLVE